MNSPRSLQKPGFAYGPILTLLRVLGLLAMLSAGSVLAQPTFLTKGLVAYYPFNGNLNDESGLNHNPKSGTITFAKDRFQSKSSAAQFDGNSVIELSDQLYKYLPTSQTSATISFWVQGKPHGYIVSQYANFCEPCSTFHIIFSPGQSEDLFQISGNGTDSKKFQVSLDDSTWSQFAITFDSKTFAWSVYIDGIGLGSFSINQNSTASSTPLLLGGMASNTEPLIGVMDDFRLYSRAFSASEVKALYEYEKVPQPINPRIATATAQTVNGFVVGASVTDGGSGYTNAPSVTITGGGGSGATARATVVNGSVTSIVIQNPGSGYSSTPIITIALPPFPPRRATGTSTVVNGFVVGASVSDGGVGYTEPPAVILVGGGGSGATATATVLNGVVTGITITNPGSGYPSAPAVKIGSPPFSPSLTIAVSRVRVTQSLVLGRKYLLESSTDLNFWNPAGPSFVAQDETVVAEFDVDSVGRYFRISQVP